MIDIRVGVFHGDRPVMIDICCCAGGASMGYSLAGWDVIGVDIDPQPNYPFPFVQCSLLDLDLQALVRQVEAVFLHGSPPCQAFTTLSLGNWKHQNNHVNLIPDCRAMFDATGLPYIIENVPTAPIRKDAMLCGEMFGLEVIRHRNFELSGWSVPQLKHIKHRGRVSGWRHGIWYPGPYFAVHGHGDARTNTVENWQRAMGINWTATRREVAEAIPPAYTNYLGEHALAAR